MSTDFVTDTAIDTETINQQKNVDSLIKGCRFTLVEANKLAYAEKIYYLKKKVTQIDGTKTEVTVKHFPVRFYETDEHIIFRPLEKKDRTSNMYTSLEAENFFLKQPRDDPNICYFGANNFDDFNDKDLPAKIFRR